MRQPKIKDKITSISLQLTSFFLLAQVIIWLISWRSLPPQLPLFYSRPWGEKQLASPTLLLLLPILSFIIVSANLLIALLTRKDNKLLSQLLIIFACLFNFSCLITLFKIITLVT
jgi:hypothetical protein